MNRNMNRINNQDNQDYIEKPKRPEPTYIKEGISDLLFVILNIGIIGITIFELIQIFNILPY